MRRYAPYGMARVTSNLNENGQAVHGSLAGVKETVLELVNGASPEALPQLTVFSLAWRAAKGEVRSF